MIATESNNANGRYVNADLHCHTNRSDGMLSPADLLARALDQKVDILAVTDHDTTAAYDDLLPARDLPIKLVSGIELSTQWAGVAVHIVGLGFDINAMAPTVAFQGDVRWQRAERLGALLEKKGVTDALNRTIEIAQGAAPGRLHFARLCVKSGLYATEADAFKKLLGAGKPGDIKSGWPDMEQAVHWIQDAGGIATVAHPHKYGMTNSKLKRLLDEFVDAGGRALEVSGTGTDNQKRQYLAQLAEQYGLLGSRGSDFHSPQQHWCDLGRVAALPEGVDPVWNHVEFLN